MPFELVKDALEDGPSGLWHWRGVLKDILDLSQEPLSPA